MELISERIALIIKHYSLNNLSFAKKIGLNSSTSINNIVGGRGSKPSFELLELILKKFNSIDANWLMTGKGEMFLRPEEKKEQTGSNQVNESVILYSCKECIHKQQIIDQQREQIETMKQLINSKDEIISQLRAKSEDVGKCG